MSEPAMNDVMRAKYGEAVRRVVSGVGNPCCGGAMAGLNSCDPWSVSLP